MKKTSLFLSVAVITCLILTNCGENYNEVKIGNQIWMTENLNVDKFRNGDLIPHAKSDAEWKRAVKEGTPVWSYYDNDLENGVKYGKLYNWYAVIDPRGLAPKGWRVPSDADWTELTGFVGNNAGTKLKSIRGWNDNGNGTDEYGFSALPGGLWGDRVSFNTLGQHGYWWSSAEHSFSDVWCRYLRSGYNNVRRFSNKSWGLSVRCLKD